MGENIQAMSERCRWSHQARKNRHVIQFHKNGQVLWFVKFSKREENPVSQTLTCAFLCHGSFTFTIVIMTWRNMEHKAWIYFQGAVCFRDYRYINLILIWQLVVKLSAHSLELNTKIMFECCLQILTSIPAKWLEPKRLNSSHPLVGIKAALLSSPELLSFIKESKL